MACSSGCPSQDHTSYADCLRSKRLKISSADAHKENHASYKMVDEYVDARREGMQPQTVFAKDVAYARKMTDKTGVPYRADE